MRRRLGDVKALAVGILAMGFALTAQAAPEMFEASFVWHAWGNDISSGATSPYAANTWTAAPLGYDCQHAEPYTVNGNPSSRYCEKSILRRGHPATGMWTRSLITTGTPPRITLQQSDFGIHLYTNPAGWPTQTDTNTPHCCRGFLITFPPYIQSWTYATFVNAAGSFFAGGGAAAANGYVNKSPKNPATAGTWRIRAGKNAFGGIMGMLGKYGYQGQFTQTGRPSIARGTSTWPIPQVVGRPLYNTIIGYGEMGTTLYRNPYSGTAMWYRTTAMGAVKVSTYLAVGSGTLWTTGQVGNFAKTGAYYTSFWRTGYDNRTPSGVGNIQLVTPTLTHWLSPGWNSHTAQLGMLTLKVPEPSAVLLLAAGAGALVALRRMRPRK
jgi:hypothetical protein